MTDQHNTWLEVPDLPDTVNPPRDLEGEQEQNLIEKIGNDMWGWLTQIEMEEETNGNSGKV